jgi:hypothetical protein
VRFLTGGRNGESHEHFRDNIMALQTAWRHRAGDAARTWLMDTLPSENPGWLK